MQEGKIQEGKMQEGKMQQEAREHTTSTTTPQEGLVC